MIFQYRHVLGGKSPHALLGWVVFRKSSPIKVCILWGNLDTYRVLLIKKVWAPYFIKFLAPGILISLDWKHYIVFWSRTSNWNFWLIWLMIHIWLPGLCYLYVNFIIRFYLLGILRRLVFGLIYWPLRPLCQKFYSLRWWIFLAWKSSIYVKIIYRNAGFDQSKKVKIHPP